MSKKAHDDFMDAALAVIKNSCTRMSACAGEPANFAEANAAGSKCLAMVTMAAGDFTIADGNLSGRKLRIAQKSAIAIDVTGTADHVALLDLSEERLLYVTTCMPQALTSGNSLSLAAWDIEIADPE